MLNQLKPLAALLVLAAGAATAQTVNTNPCGTVPASNWGPVPFKPLSSAPSALGTQVRLNEAGGVAWWDGPDGSKNFVAATTQKMHDAMLPSQIIDAVLYPKAGETTLSGLNAILLKNGDTAWLDPKLTAVWCPYEKELLAFLAPPPPPPKPTGWVVSKYSTQTTRPAFPVNVMGYRSTTSSPTIRAVVGAVCTPSIMEGTTVYGTTTAIAPLVALCNKVP